MEAIFSKEKKEWLFRFVYGLFLSVSTMKAPTIATAATITAVEIAKYNSVGGRAVSGCAVEVAGALSTWKDVSDDPLLQGRLFSYKDTQLTRLGGPNFNQIPINKPLVPVVNNQRDGFHQLTVPQGRTAYTPNSLNDGYPMPGLNKNDGFGSLFRKCQCRKIWQRSEFFNDHFSQATLFWNSMFEPEKVHIIKAFHFEVGKVNDATTRQKVAQSLPQTSIKIKNALKSRFQKQ